MAKSALSLPRTVVNWKIGPERDMLDWSVSLTGTSTLTVPVFLAPQRLHIRKLAYSASGATDGAKTIKIHNQTQNVDITTALTINGLAALANTPFVMNDAAGGGADSNLYVAPSDVIVAVYTVTTAGAVAPGTVALSGEFTLSGRYK